MSHIASYKTKIRVNPLAKLPEQQAEDPTWQILKEAVEAAAQEFNGRVANHVTDWYGNHVACDMAVTAPGFSRGVGVRVLPSGEVTFVFDPYGDRQKLAQRISDQIVRNYSLIAVTRALKSMNYDVEFEESGEAEEKAVLVRGIM